MVYFAKGVFAVAGTMLRIVDIRAREILDSRGIPTVEADVYIEGVSVAGHPSRQVPRRGHLKPSKGEMAIRNAFEERECLRLSKLLISFSSFT